MLRNGVFLIIWVVILGGCQQQSSTRILKLAHGLNHEHPVHKAFEFLAKEVAAQSNGKLKIDIYPSAQLGAERECLELLQIGSLDITKVSCAVMEGFVPEYKVLGIPYLFKGREHAYDVLDGPVGHELLRLPEKFWLKGLCFYDAGARSFYTKNTPVKHPEDVKGLKIRVMKSNMAVKMVNAFNASPTPISWGELYTALQSGVVDGAENNPPSFYTSRHYEVCKHYTLNEHTRVPDVMLISVHTWGKLNETERNWLQDAVTKSVDYQRKLWQEDEQKALEEVKKAGVEVTIPDKGLFAEKVEPLIKEFSKDQILSPLIKQIREEK